VRSHEAKGIVSVYLGNHGGDLGECWFGGWVEHTLTNAGYVAGDAVDAVGVYAAEVGGDEAVGDCGGVGGGDAVGFQDGFDEDSGGGVGDVEFFGFLGLVGHGEIVFTGFWDVDSDLKMGCGLIGIREGETDQRCSGKQEGEDEMHSA